MQLGRRTSFPWNAALGAAAGAAAVLLWNAPNPPDALLERRVRALLKRCCSHPEAIHVSSRKGFVELRGPVLATDYDQVLDAVEHLRGVSVIDDDLDVHDRADVAELKSPAQRPNLDVWSDQQRLLMGSLGIGLAALGLARRGLVGAGTAALGFGLMARSVASRTFSDLATGGEPSMLHVERSVELGASVEYVFALWDNLEHFPKFMTHVREVRRTGPDEYHWKVDGPGGVMIEWDAVVTAREPNRSIAWKTIPGSRLLHEGRVEFERVNENMTRLAVRFSYHPPAGALGHAIAKLLGTDPGTEMEEDLRRLRGLVSH